MNNIVLLGGCSKSGKSTLVQEIYASTFWSNGKRHEIVMAEGKRLSMDYKKNFDLLELEAIKTLKSSPTKEDLYIMDMHFTYQPALDSAYAFDGKVLHDKEQYLMTVSQAAIESYAEHFNIMVVYLYATPETILNRRIELAKQGKLMRSLDLNNIKEEMQHEQEKALIFYEQTARLNPHTSYRAVNNASDTRKAAKSITELIKGAL